MSERNIHTHIYTCHSLTMITGILEILLVSKTLWINSECGSNIALLIYNVYACVHKPLHVFYFIRWLTFHTSTKQKFHSTEFDKSS